MNAAPVNPGCGVKLVDLVGLLDYLVLNETEAELLTGKKLDSRRAALEVTKEILDTVQCLAVITTLGSQGAIVATKSDPPGLDHVPAPDVGTALDTTVSSAMAFSLCYLMHSLSFLSVDFGHLLLCVSSLPPLSINIPFHFTGSWWRIRWLIGLLSGNTFRSRDLWNGSSILFHCITKCTEKRHSRKFSNSIRTSITNVFLTRHGNVIFLFLLLQRASSSSSS